MKKKDDKIISSSDLIDSQLAILNNIEEDFIEININKDINDPTSLNLHKQSEIEKKTLEPTIFGDWQINCKTIDF